MAADQIRAFVAVELPSEFQELISSAFAAEHARYPGLRWVSPENLHLTVKFIGQVPGSRVPELVRAIEKACSGQQPFRVSLAGAGVFPPRGLPRVLWVGLGCGGAELSRLAAEVDRRLGKRGIERERRPFAAHLTLARQRRGVPAQDLGPLCAQFAGRDWGAFDVRSLSLMQSNLGAGGAGYERLAGIPFAD